MSQVRQEVYKQEEEKLLSNKVFATLIFIFTEVMFFTALISAFLIIRGDEKVSWEIPLGVKLPVLATAYNSLVLIGSGLLLFLAGLSFKKERSEKIRSLLGWSTVLGAFFVCFQGYEWMQLISYGLTMKSSIFGACFFLLIGTHGIHALLGVLVLAYLYMISKNKLDHENIKAVQIFWFFIVGLWPLLYGLVYFGH